MRATAPTPPAIPPIRAPFDELVGVVVVLVPPPPELELPAVGLEPGEVAVDAGLGPAPVPVAAEPGLPVPAAATVTLLVKAQRNNISKQRTVKYEDEPAYPNLLFQLELLALSPRCSRN